MDDDLIPNLPQHLGRGARRGEDESIASAIWLIEEMTRRVGYSDLADVELLDVGCGIKFTQAILARSIPIKGYVGLDVYAPMIEKLRTEVDDRRFEYHHINAHNELYNPEGVPMSEIGRLPIGDREFDLIGLFSVFTHLAPHDYRTMLELLRGHVRPEGRLFFTLFVNEATPGGHGLVDSMNAVVEKADRADPQEATLREAADPPPFVDFDPSRPLVWAVYSREHAFELIDGTGWEVVDLFDPEEYMQHQFVCRPV